MAVWSFVPALVQRLIGNRLGSERMLDARQFRSALERERLRADRMGTSFSFIEFDTRSRPAVWTETLVMTLEQRLRLTDEFGVHGLGLGAILPETSEDAARNVAEGIARGCPADPPVSWRVFAYPDVSSNGTSSDRGSVRTGAGARGVVQEAGEPVATGMLFVKPLPLWKRAIDIAVASIGLVLAGPALAFAATAIKATSPGPILFLQRRTGLGGRPFTIYKLRTMRNDAERLKAGLRSISEQDGPAFKLKNDPRVTAVGKYLRKTCIDELPQLWNVLRGDMTLVGPRPLPCDESDGCAVWQKRRLDVTPGLTCIWQVNSGRSRVAFADWMRMDLRYVRGRTLLADARLLWKTFLAVILHRASH